MNARDSERGFTLLEMLVVLVVIAMIAAVAIPQVMRLLGSAKHRAAAIQIETLSQSLQSYELDLGGFPSTQQGLAALWANPADSPSWNGPYVRRKQQLLDPWGHAFVYTSPGVHAPFDLVSLGADGKPGGTGDDADVSSAD